MNEQGVPACEHIDQVDWITLDMKQWKHTKQKHSMFKFVSIITMKKMSPNRLKAHKSPWVGSGCDIQNIFTVWDVPTQNPTVCCIMFLIATAGHLHPSPWNDPDPKIIANQLQTSPRQTFPCILITSISRNVPPPMTNLQLWHKLCHRFGLKQYRRLGARLPRSRSDGWDGRCACGAELRLSPLATNHG